MGANTDEKPDISNLFFNLPTGVIYQNARGEITGVNAAAEKILGLTFEQMRGKANFDILLTVLAGDGSDYPVEDYPSVVALKTGEVQKDKIMGIFHPQKQSYRWLSVDAVPEFRNGEEKPFQVFITFRDVTNNVLTTKKLQKREHDYKMLVDNMHSGFVIIQNGIIQYANKAVFEKTGVESGELVGCEFLQWIAPEEREKVANFYVKRLAGENVPENYRSKLITKEGKLVWFSFRVKKVEYDGKPTVLVLMNDIDRRVRAEQRLSDSETLFRGLFENAPIGISLVGYNGKPIVVNSRLTEITGYSAEELKRMNFSDFTHPDDIEPERELCRELVTGKRQQYQLYKRYIHKDGHVVWGELKASMVKDSEGRKLVVRMLADHTDQKRAEDELLIARDKANESSKLKSAFLASISHELRNPLNAVLGFSDIIQNTSKDPEISEYSNLIYEAGFKVMTIIDDILDLAMSEHGLIHLRPKTFLLGEVFDEFRRELQEILYRYGKDDRVAVRCSVEEHLETKAIVTDKSKVYQVMVNLIKNAVKFTEDGFIKLSCHQPDEENVSFSIQDSGIGISENQQEAIFDFFRQSEGQDHNKYGGIGIGLAISKKIATAMYGDITVESVPGEGTTFTFTLPMDVGGESTGSSR
ncbi:MAG: PAS domain S-box protein [Marinilabilia sp.]